MQASKGDNPEFSRWRQFLWPIHRHELRKLIPMLVIFFLVSLDYNILRTMKDVLVVTTAKASGAEVIPFIKVWAMFPGAVLMTYLYTKLSNRLSRERVIYIIFSLFLLFFAVFTFILYPYRDAIHPTTTADFLQNNLPDSFKWVIAMYRNWIFTSFYVMSEMWSNIVLFLLFWGFANQVTRLNEAKRFYGLFGLGINLSGIFAGQLSVYCSRLPFNPALPFGEEAWDQSMFILISIVLVSGVIAIYLFRWFNRTILSDPLYYDAESVRNDVKVKGKLSFKDNFSYLLKSPYMLSIAVIVISYNVVINLVEVLWKHELRELYPISSDYSIYMNQVSTIIGLIATLNAIFISGNSIRKFGWTFTALLTPIILLVTSVGFFAYFFMKEYQLSWSVITFGLDPLVLVVFFGSAQNIMSRAAKYSVFDATKEMAFVPLDLESKMKGKAAIDGVCSRFGKSGGSFIHQTLLLKLGSFSASAPYVAACLISIIMVWSAATRFVGTKFIEMTNPQPKPIPLRTVDEDELIEQKVS